MYSKITVILYIISMFLLAKEISTLKCFTCVGCESGDILSNITCGNRIGNETTAAPTNENITINWSCYKTGLKYPNTTIWDKGCQVDVVEKRQTVFFAGTYGCDTDYCNSAMKARNFWLGLPIFSLLILCVFY